jgi:hypothetical protein
VVAIFGTIQGIFVFGTFCIFIEFIQNFDNLTFWIFSFGTNRISTKNRKKMFKNFWNFGILEEPGIFQNFQKNEKKFYQYFAFS